MKVTQNRIDAFFASQPIAIAGVSRDEKKFGHQVYLELKRKGYVVYPINPNVNEVAGEKCYSNLDELPLGVNALLILTPKSETDEVLRLALKRGITNIWVQQMSASKDTVDIAQNQGVPIIHNKCIFMFAQPVEGVHKFHRALHTFFGLMPVVE